MMLNKRGISLPINVVVTAIVAVMVLTLVAIFVTGGGKSLGGRYSSFAKTAVRDIHVTGVLNAALNTQAAPAETDEPCEIATSYFLQYNRRLVCDLSNPDKPCDSPEKFILTMKACEVGCRSSSCKCKSAGLTWFDVDDQSPWTNWCNSDSCIATTAAKCVKKAGAG